MSWIRTDVIRPQFPSGYGPAQLQAAYNLPSSTNGVGKTIAIVDAFDDPTAEADLAAYRLAFGLSLCTTANGCFLKVNQNGNTSPLPAGNKGWAEEESLDLDMASAICPNCNIVLVEASNNGGGLYIAENTAAGLCAASVISNSWAGSEYNGETSDDLTYFHHPGVPMTFASGDGDYPGGYPAAGKYVTAVGGTRLTGGPIIWTESVWNTSPGAEGTGSLCSFYESQAAWQTALGSSYTSICSTRIENDVAAVADPGTGVAVYDTALGDPGWEVFGGTSVATPIIAGVYALAPNSGSINDASYLYSHMGSFNDVSSGNNGPCTPTGIYTTDFTGTFICVAGPGFDGPTGVGTPNGIGGF